MAETTKSQVQTLDGSQIFFEDVNADIVWQQGTLKKAGTNDEFVQIVADGVDFANGAVIEIAGETESYAKRWFVTQYDEGTQLDYNAVIGLFGDEIPIDTPIEFRIIPMLRSCLVTSGSWDLGSITTGSIKTACGELSYSSGKEAGTVSFDFVKNFSDKVQKQLMDTFQFDYQQEFQIAVIPPNDNIMIGATVAITGNSFSIDETYSGSCEFQLRSPTWSVWLPEN